MLTQKISILRYHLLKALDSSEPVLEFRAANERQAIEVYNSVIDNIKCQHCKESSCAIRSEFVLCSGCTREESGAHLDCTEPPLPRAPPGNWYCTVCIEKGTAATYGETNKTLSYKSQYEAELTRREQARSSYTAHKSRPCRRSKGSTASSKANPAPSSCLLYTSPSPRD